MTDPQLLGCIAALTEPEHTVLLQLLREVSGPLTCGHHPLFLDQISDTNAPRFGFCRVCTLIREGSP